MPDSAGRKIDTREELIAALNLAAELEHSLLIQYLFAAFSCRNQPSPAALTAEGDNAWRSLDVVRSIQDQLFAICREEMAHLATVSNLLSSIGAPPHLTRPPMEEVKARLYGQSHAPIRFSLTRMSGSSLRRFQQFEEAESETAVRPDEPIARCSREPRPAKPIPRGAPDAFDYKSVGGLYRLIEEGFNVLFGRLGPGLFVGAARVQDRWHWDASLRITPVTDIFSARAAIQFIVTEGEGSSGARGTGRPDPRGSHFDRIGRMRKLFKRASRRTDLHAHVWPVLSNPATRLDRAISGRVNLLPTVDHAGNPAVDYQCAELCNAIYTCMLHLLAQFYDPAGESADARLVLAHSSKQTMSAILRPVCEMLVQLPATGYLRRNAGPPFELYDDIRLPARAGDRTTLLLERVAHLGRVCRALAPAHPILARLTFVAENVDYLSSNLARALPQA